MKKNNIYGKIEFIFSTLSIIFIVIHTIEYFNIFGGLKFLHSIHNINSYLLIFTGVAFILSNIFEILSKKENNVKISKIFVIINLLFGLLFIHLGLRIWDLPRGTCPFSGARPTNYELIPNKFD